MSADGVLGREPDLAVLAGFLGVCAVDTAALVLSGDAGVGKSALLDLTAADARTRGFRVLRASGAEFEQDIAFAGLHQLLSPLLTERTGPLAVTLGMAKGTPPSRAEVVDAVIEVLDPLRPVLVVVDDLHWIDRPSAMVLEDVVRRRPLRQAGFLFAVRGSQHVDGAGSFRVRPLAEEAATAVLRERFPAMAEQVRRRLVAEAQGNPLALLELPVQLSPEQWRGSRSLPETLPLGERLREVFATRVSALPERARQALLLAALEKPAPLDPAETEDLAPAVRAGLVGVTDGEVVFRHPLTRSAVVALSTSAERRQAHATLAERLRDRPDRHIWHLARTAVAPDAHIAALLDQAAERTRRRGDTAGAVTALLRAAELSPTGAARGRRLVEAAYIGAVAGGDLRRVPRLLDDARRCLDNPEPPLVSAVTAAHYLLLSGEGDIDTAHRLLVAALDMRPDAADDTAVEAVTTLGWVCYFGGRAELWAAFHRIVGRWAEVPHLVTLLGAFLGDPARAALPRLAELDDAIAALDEHVPPIALIRTSLAAIFVDRLPACRERLFRLRAQADQAATIRLHTLSLLSLERLTAGAWDEALELADEQVRLAEEHGYALLRSFGLYTQAMVAAGRGDDRTVVDVTNRMLGWAAPRGVLLVGRIARQALTLAALGRGDFDAAYRHASSVSPPGTLPSHVPHALWFVLDLTEAALGTGRPEEARTHVAAARAVRLEAISPRYGLLVDGADAMSDPDNDTALARFDEVLARPEVRDHPFEHARILLRHGERLRRARMNRQARDQLERAGEIFAELGAKDWLDRAGRELQPAGQNRRAAALTAQQRTIVELAAEGLTNKQIAQRLFLSSRTVGNQLYQAFPKLGVTSRAGLRDAMRGDRE
ncbi:AAA family ATPase [Kutzneria sp. NPDC052558]|uniref:AAA family ATPase n=1 Tax=Kutzneria sp. NPDC052558 TaxID=3364121 RepID=UPI0037C9C1A1